MSATPYRDPFLTGIRTTLFSATLLEVIASFGMQRLRRSGGKTLSLRDRAGWLHDGSRNMLRRIGTEVIAEGEPPLQGLIVSNHLSYVDVLVYSSLAPCVFVSKQEVRGWPVLGPMATMAGTIYVNRERSSANGSATALMEEALRAQIPVILFPEGTSSDGGTVLPFRSPFFEPAVRTSADVMAAAIGYDSDTASEAALAYYGDEVFGPHLLRTLGQRRLRARVAFGIAGQRYTDRKAAARTTQAEVEALRHFVTCPPKGCSRADADRLTRTA